MPFTNAENQQRHRQRLIETLGIDEYRRINNERRKANYYKDRPVIDKPTIDIPIEQLKPINKKLKPINKTIIKDSTASVYIRIIKIIYKHFTNNDLSDDNDVINAINSKPFKYKNIKTDFAFLFDKTTFDDIIKNHTTYLKPLYCIFTRIHGFATFVKKLYPYLEKIKHSYQDCRAKRSISDDIINSISFNKDDIIAKTNTVSLSNHKKILVYLTMLIPTRRLHDYRFTKIAKSIPDSSFDKSFNYYFDKRIYIFNTKNSKHAVIDLPNEIVELINSDDEFLLGKFYDDSNLADIYNRTIYKIYNLKINPTLMRILYSTYLRSQNLSGNEWEKKAAEMGHSLAENIKYSIPNNLGRKIS